MKPILIIAALAAVSGCMRDDTSVISTRSTYSPIGFIAAPNW